MHRHYGRHMLRSSKEQQHHQRLQLQLQLLSCSVPQLLSCSFEPKSKPDGPAGEQLNCHLGFSVFPSCLSPVAVAVVWLQILKLQLLALHMQLQLFHLPQLSHSPQIFKCLACDFSWSQRNGMESLGLARVSNDCGLRRRRR